MNQPAMQPQNEIADDRFLDMVFREARTYNEWEKQDVSDVTIRALYELLKFAPTSANCSPARFIFVKSDEAKARLKPHLAEGNVDKTMNAPVCVLIANDKNFYEHLPKLFPHTDAKSWFEGNDELIEATAMRNGTLQGGYLIMAARSLGLDCGPMSGFDTDGVNKEFFGGRDNIEVNFICNLGYGKKGTPFPRSPRFEFDEICEII